MVETQIVQVSQRRICWPDPDWCCLEGGCGYCNDGPFKNVGQIARYAREVGVREYPEAEGGGTRDYWASFVWGRNYGWPNTQKRTVPKRVPR
jgi:hypothetical protein